MPAGAASGDGQRAFAVRKDRVMIAPASEAEAVPRAPYCQIDGRVRAVEYEGAMFKVSVELSDGEFLVALVPQHDFMAAGVDRGVKVIAWWHPEDVHVLNEDRTARGGG